MLKKKNIIVQMILAGRAPGAVHRKLGSDLQEQADMAQGRNQRLGNDVWRPCVASPSCLALRLLLLHVQIRRKGRRN